MNKWIILTLVFAITVTAGAFLSAASAKQQAEPTKTQVQQTQEVKLESIAVDPNIFFLKIGEKLRFSNADGEMHEIASGQGNSHGMNHDHVAGGLESGPIPSNEAYEVSFDKEGVFYFHDNYHPDTSVSVIVSK